MGKCLSKPQPELEETPMIDFTALSADQGDQNRPDFKYSKSSDDMSDTKTNDDLLAGMKQVNLLGDVDGLDVDYKYKPGIFYDNDISMWFRLIFVLEDDIIRKQFLSFYGLNLKHMEKDEFQSWCDKHGYPKTKKYYDFYKLLDCFPYSRLLNGLAHKYNVKFHISDLFLYKGKGPFRAITCCARNHSVIDKALNEYENRITKKKVIYSINKHWDNHIFPDPTVDSKDHSHDFPFSWPRHIRPEVPELLKWPFDYSKNSPSVFRKLINDSRSTVSDATDVVKTYGVYGEKRLNSRLKFPETPTVTGSQIQVENEKPQSLHINESPEISEHTQ